MPLMIWPYTILWVAFLPTFLLLALRLINRGKHTGGLRVPPGPPGKFLLGNIGDMPSHHLWETFTRWANEYGDLVYIKVLGQPIVIVNSAKVAHDLFDKRSSLYSDRCDFPMINDLMGGEWGFSFMKYGRRWRRHRKVFHQKFHPAAVAAYHPIQIEQTLTLLQKLYASPEDYAAHLRHHSGAIIMQVVYGIKVLPEGDPYIKVAEEALSGIKEAGNPGSFLVDVLPILRYVPEWVPGAAFQKKARLWRKAITEMRVAPFNAVKNGLDAGTAEPSVTASLLEELPQRSGASERDEEEVIRNAGGVAYGAGSDTTATALIWFILAMVLHPETQRKGQAEIDSVIEADRLPVFEDREKLPFVNAICKEVLRWHPLVPLGIAHRVTQDDVYGDYLIPGGSIVFGNTWAILRDTDYGTRPEKFEPERFLEPGVKDPTAAFGYGRRICPGRFLADNSLFISIVSILKVFDLSPATDNFGNSSPIGVSSTSGFFACPEPFACTIKPRSETTSRLLFPDA